MKLDSWTENWQKPQKRPKPLGGLKKPEPRGETPGTLENSGGKTQAQWGEKKTQNPGTQKRGGPKKRANLWAKKRGPQFKHGHNPKKASPGGATPGGKGGQKPGIMREVSKMGAPKEEGGPPERGWTLSGWVKPGSGKNTPVREEWCSKGIGNTTQGYKNIFLIY